MTSETPSFPYIDSEGQEKIGEILIGKPEDVWIQLVQECKTEKELKELEDHVHLFKNNSPDKPKYYIILTDVQPKNEEMYLSRFNARRIPLNMDKFLLRVNETKSLAHLPPMFDQNKSLVFEIAGYDL
jgi:hypothetical protein